MSDGKDIKIENRTSEERSTATERRGGGPRSGEIAPPHDFFTLNPFSLMRRLSEEMDRAFATSFGLAPTSGCRCLVARDRGHRTR